MNETTFLDQVNNNSGAIIAIATIVFLIANLLLYLWIHRTQKSYQDFNREFLGKEEPRFIADVKNHARPSFQRLVFFQVRIKNRGRSDAGLLPVQQAELNPGVESSQTAVVPIVLLPGDYPLDQMITMGHVEFLELHGTQSAEPFELVVKGGHFANVWVGVLFNPNMYRGDEVSLSLQPIRGSFKSVKLRHGTERLSPI